MYMLDTDICIYIIKQKPKNVLDHFERLQQGDICISAITFAELVNGAKKSQRIEENMARLNELAELLVIAPFDQAAAIAYGDVRSALEKKGNIIGGNDLLIASHACILMKNALCLLLQLAIKRRVSCHHYKSENYRTIFTTCCKRGHRQKTAAWHKRPFPYWQKV